MSRPRLNPELTLNELVAADPRVLPILSAHGLDTCCGGAHTLSDAARLHGLNLPALLAALRAFGRDA